MPQKMKKANLSKKLKPTRPPVAIIIAATTLLLLAILGAGLMSAKTIWSISLPGCGQDPGCDWALKSAWSKVLGWPVAFLGLAFFAGLATLWLTTVRRGVWGKLVHFTRLGAGVSLLFIIVMVTAGHYCVWCLTTHLANLSWWIMLELISARTQIRRRIPWQTIVVGAFIFLITVISVKALEYRQQLLTQAAAHEKAIRSVGDIGRAEPVGNEWALPASPSVKFGGRYWRGNPDAPVRIVVFQDYQCQYCREVEGKLNQILASRSDFALSIKQWPFDTSCNRYILTGKENIHPGACLAARAVEAAGILGGNEAFWSLHKWLVDRNGRVDLDDIKGEIVRLGIDAQRFEQMFNNAVVDSILLSDIEDGALCGLKQTPTVFVNGYEVQGWQSAGALPAAIERAAQMAAQNPKSNDMPDPAVDKEFQNWLVAPAVALRVQIDDHARGATNAPIIIFVYGDISDPYNAAASRMLEPLLLDSQHVRLIFRNFPMQPECNDLVKRQINTRACEAARLIEAAALIGGEAAFWKMHSWMIAQADSPPESMATQAAADCRLDPKTLTKAVQDAKVEQRIAQYVESAKLLGITTSPTIFVNGKRVNRWRLPGLLERIISHCTTATP